MSENAMSIRILAELDSVKTENIIKSQLKEIQNKLNVSIGVDTKLIQNIAKQVKDIQQTINKQSQGIKIIDDKEAIANINKIDKGTRVLFTSLSEAVKEYSKLGNVKIENAKLNPITKEVEAFTLRLKNADETLERMRFNIANIGNGANLTKVFERTDIKFTDNSKEIAEKVLNEEIKINSALKEREKQKEKLLQKTKEELELYKRNAQIDSNKLLNSNSKTLDKTALKQWIADVQKLNVETPNLNNKLKQMSLSLKEIKADAATANQQTASIGKSLKSAFTNLPIYMGSASIIYGTVQGFKNMLNVIVEVDQKLTNLKKVMDQGTNFDNVMQSAINMSEKFSQSIVSSLDALETFAKQGYTEDQLETLGNAAMIASNVAEMTSQQTAEYLTSTLTQWKMNSDEALGIVDSWNNISNNFSTTSQKLAAGQAKAGSTARVMAMDFHELNAMIGTVTQSTKESGEQVGNFIKNVLPRLTSKPAQKALDMVGVSLFDDDGNMRNVIDIYTEVANKVKDMDKYSKSIVLEGLAGKHHISRMSAFIDDLGSANSLYSQMYEASVKSAGSAESENETYMRSLTARIQNAKLELEKLALAFGDAFVTETMIETLHTFSEITSGIGSLVKEVGALPLIFGLAGSSILLFNKNLRTLSTSLIFGTGQMKRMELAGKTLSVTLKSLGAATAIGAVFALIGIVAEKVLSASQKARQAQEDLEQKNKELMSTYKESQEDINNLTTEYERLQQTINSGKYTSSDLERYKQISSELASLMPSLVVGEDQYGNKILGSAESVRAKVDLLERQLAIQNKLDAQERKETAVENYDTAKDSLEDYEKKLDNVIHKTNQGLRINRGRDGGIAVPVQVIKSYDDIIAKINELEEKSKSEKLSANDQFDLDYLRKMQDEYTKVGLKVDDAKMVMVNANNEIISSTLATKDDISNSAKSLISDFSLFASSTNESSKSIDKLLHNLNNGLENDSSFKKSLNDYGNAIDEYKKKIAQGAKGDELQKYKDQASKAFDTVKEKLLSLAKDGKFSEESLTNLAIRLGILANSSTLTSQDIDTLSKSTGKSKEEIMNQLLLVPELADEIDNLGDSAQGAADDFNKLSTASEVITGISQKQIDKTNEAIATYKLLNDMENANAEQKQLLEDATKSLAAMYPHLVDEGDLLIEQMEREKEANDLMLKAVNKLADGTLNAEEAKTVQQALAIKTRLNNMSKELRALSDMMDAYNQAAQSALEQSRLLYSQGNNAVAESAQQQAAASIGMANKVNEQYDTTKNKINALIPKLDSYSGSLADITNYNGKYYKSAENAKKATDKQKDSMEKSTYVVDKYAKSLENLGVQLDKIHSIQSQLPEWSQEYRNALNKELTLLREKKSILEAQSKELQNQIKTGNVVKYGVSTTKTTTSSSPSSKATGGSTQDIIWNFFKQKGLSDSAVAGIMGNLQLESNFNPSAVNKSSGATGIAQWLGGRLTGLKSYAKSIGTTYTDLNTQLQWLWKELNSTENKTLKYLQSNSGSSASTLAAGFERLFERSGGAAVGTRQGYANNIYSKYSGKTVAVSSSGNTSKDAAQHMADLDEVGSKIKQLDSELISLDDRIREIEQVELIQSKTNQYEFLIGGVDRYIQKSQSVMKQYLSTSAEYRKELENQAKQLKYKQRLLHEEAEYLREQINSGKLSKKLVSEYQVQVSNLSLAWWDVQEQLKSTSFDKLTSHLDIYKEGVEKLNKELELSQAIMSNYKEDSEEYRQEIQKQIELTQRKIKETEDEARAIKRLMETEKLSAVEKKALQDRLDELTKSYWDLTAVIKNNEEVLNRQREEYADKVIDAMKKAYETERDYKSKLIEQEMDEKTKAHEKKLEMIDEENRKYEESIQKQRRLIDDQESEDNFNEQLNGLLKEQQDLQSEIFKLKLDDSEEAGAKRYELEKQLDDKIKEIEKLKKNRSNDLRKKDLDDQLDAYQKDIEAKKKAEDQKYNLEKERLELEKKENEYYYNELIANEAKFQEMKTDIVKNGTSNVQGILNGFLEQFKNMNAQVIKEIGMSWQELQNQISNMEGLPSKYPTAPPSSNNNNNNGTQEPIISQREKDWQKYLQNKLNWETASTAKKKQLNQENIALREKWLFPDGSYTDLKKLKIGQYHTGGVVGGIDTKYSNFINNLLKPNEEFAKLLKGEVVLSKPQLPILANNIANLQNAALRSNQPQSQPSSVSFDVDINIDKVANNMDINKIADQVINRTMSKMKPYGFIR